MTFNLLCLGFLILPLVALHANDINISDGQTIGGTQLESSNASNPRRVYIDRQLNDINCTWFTIETNFSVLQNGSLFVPRTQSVHSQYFLNDSLAYVCDIEDKPTSNTDDIYHRYSDDFLNCGHILIEPHEYKLLNNGTVVVSIYSRMYDPTDYFIQEQGVYVCLPEYEEMKKTIGVNATYNRKFPDSFFYVSYVGMSISVVSLLCHLVFFSCISSVRNLPGYCLASLSISLLCAYVCLLSTEFVHNTDYCASIGVSVYYFFLTAFFWMNTIAFDVWRSFRVVTKELRISRNRVSWKRFFIYSVYSWLAPAILVVGVYFADVNELLPSDLKPSFGAPLCWFSKRKSLLLFFATPLIIVMLLNAAFFLDVTYVISKAALKTRQSLHEATLRKRFFMFLKLALIMGLTWIVGIIAGSVDNIVMFYLFIVLNTLQGLFIFVVFSLSSKVKNLFCKFSQRSRSGISTSIRTISQAV